MTTWCHKPEDHNLHKFSAFENRALRRIFGHTKEEAAGAWKKLNNQEFHNLYSSPNFSTLIRSRIMK